MKNKGLFILFFVTFIIGTFGFLSNRVYASDVVISGDCGDSVTYTLDSDGLLTISGTGKMTNYSAGGTPWNSYTSSIKSVVIEDGVTSIGDWAFATCLSLIDVDISYSVTCINSYAFAECASLTSIIIPDNVTVIGSHTFYFCTSLTNIVLGWNVSNIGTMAFQNCTSLVSIDIPDSMVIIGAYAFEDCNSIRNVYYSGAETEWNNIIIENHNDPLTNATIYYNVYTHGYCGGEGDGTNLTWILYNDYTLIISGSGNMKDYFGCGPWGSSVDSVIIEEGVTSIGNWSFWGSGIESVSIGNSVISIGEGAFAYCTSLKSINIPDSVTRIGLEAFMYDNKLKSLYITDLTAYCNIVTEGYDPKDSTPLYCGNGGNLYLNNELVTDLVIPEGVTSIPCGRFAGCTSIESVVISDSVGVINGDAFLECTNLRNITIGEGVTSIYSDVFRNCSSLEEVNFNAINCTLMNSSVLYGCTALIKFNIGNKVENIPNYILHWVTGVKEIVIPASVKTIGEKAFLLK